MSSVEDRHFASEVEMLKRFNGHVHPNFVTLLATFTYQDRNHLIFPWAECDLYSYWEHNGAPSTSGDFLWLSEQILGLATALNLIHNPSLKDVSTGEYGRHGDVKPENILWFKSTHDTRGIFVITDLGLSSMNSDKSRSNVPNNAVAFSVTYRPPEVDIEHGYISRSSDIWSLGCMFLEMISWMLGGWESVKSFSLARVAPSTMGFNTDNFFDMLQVEDSEAVDEDATGEESTETGSKSRVSQFTVKKQVIKVCGGQKDPRAASRLH